jgi:hypothetical protein
MVSSDTATQTSPLPLHNAKFQTPAHRCSICNEVFGQPRADGLAEYAVILPCTHIFGSYCIARWLESSLNHDCPNCRRKMVYKECGHAIKAREIESAPECVAESDMPQSCVRCSWSEVAEGELRALSERRLAEERALGGLKMYMPGVFGGMARQTSESVDKRIEELRKQWMAEIEAAICKIEERDGRKQW